MAGKEATDLDDLLTMYTHGMELPDMSASTDYVFDFDQFVAESFEGSEENMTSFDTNPIDQTDPQHTG